MLVNMIIVSIALDPQLSGNHADLEGLPHESHVPETLRGALSSRLLKGSVTVNAHLMKMNSYPKSSHPTNSAARAAARFAHHSLCDARAVARFALYSRSAARGVARVALRFYSAARAAARIAPLAVACGSLLSLPTVLNVSSAPRAAAPRIYCWRVLPLRPLVVDCGSLSSLPTVAFDKLNVSSAPRAAAPRIHCWRVLFLRPLS